MNHEKKKLIPNPCHAFTGLPIIYGIMTPLIGILIAKKAANKFDLSHPLRTIMLL
jgi:hypothetical protein